MADPNAFSNKEIEDLNLKIKKEIEIIKKNLNVDQLKKDIQADVETIKKDLVSEGLLKGDLLSSENRSYVDTLPSDYKDKALRYLDIFRDNPDLVSEYLEILKKHGSEKAAKEAGTTNVLFYPSKILKHLSNNPEIFDEETVKRQTAFDLQGGSIYDIAYREDEIGKKKQEEYYGKYSTKILGGISEAGYNTMRTIADIVAKVTDAVGPENATSAVEYVQSKLPHSDDVTYPNKTKPWDQDSAIQELTKELSQFGIDVFLGGRLIKILKGGATKVAPGQVKKITDYVTKGKPLKTKAGKEIADSFGNIKYASSIAQKMGGWGLPIAVKYGLGRTITSETDPTKPASTTFSEGFGWMPTLTREQYEKMTSKDKAIYSLKKKLIHGAEGTVLIGGLTKAIGVGGKVLWGGTKWAGRAVSGPAETLIFNPISGIIKSRKTGIPQLAKGIRNAG